MSLFLDDGDVRLHHGDALETLRLLPDGCVDMVATSPPFYGLRDYGTGTWEGGDESCDHMRPLGGGMGKGTIAGSQQVEERRQAYAGTCGKCGARRVDRQIGLEETPDQWVNNLVAVFRECRRVLADHGTLWVEIGDSYYAAGWESRRRSEVGSGSFAPEDRKSHTGILPGMKAKDLVGGPWMLAFALRADGWYLRSEIIWARPNPMPESVTDRPTKSHSTVFLLSKQPRYFYDADAIREASKEAGKDYGHSGKEGDRSDGLVKPGWRNGAIPAMANARSVWTIPTQPTPFAHFATWPQKLVARMIQAGTSERGKCPVCGKPWVREVESELGPSNRKPDARAYVSPHGTDGGGSQGLSRSATHVGGLMRHVTTLGWSPSCTCSFGDGLGPRNAVPCTVLDPFAGSGTTLLVARNHGRHAIGIELNADYCQIAAQQLQQLSLLTQPVEQPETTRVSRGGRGTGLTGGAYNPPGQSPHSNARPRK